MRDRTAWLQGGAAVCQQPPPRVKRAWRLVLLVPPGIDQATLAGLFFNALGVCPLFVRDALQVPQPAPSLPGSEIAEAQVQLEHGEPIADQTLLRLIRERGRCLQCSGGFLLVGAPQSPMQAEALDALLAEMNLRLDAVLGVFAPLDALVSRVAGIRACPRCQATYHIAHQRPRISGVCDQCDSPLIQRPEDQPDSLRAELDTHLSVIGPVVDYYQTAGTFRRIEAGSDPVDILARSLDCLASLGLPV